MNIQYSESTNEKAKLFKDYAINKKAMQLLLDKSVHMYIR